MKKIIILAFLLIILNLFFTNKISAQEHINTRYYDCGETGKCKESENENEALYADNLAPGIASQQEWYLDNQSNKSCRIYLRLKSLDDEELLPEKIFLSAFTGVGEEKKVIINQTRFSKLLKKQSMSLVKIPAQSTINLTWNILLDESVGNGFQATQKKFSTLLYSYCLDDMKGEVAGVATTTSGVRVEEVIYLTLVVVSGSSLVLLKIIH